MSRMFQMWWVMPVAMAGVCCWYRRFEPDWYPYSADMIFARGSELYKINTTGTPVESQLTTHGVDEAQMFHDRWRSYGLPMPFERLPFNVEQVGQIRDPLGWFRQGLPTDQVTQPVQGFGPTSFAYGNKTKYNPTFQIHSGVDYGNGTWDDRVIVSLCDGVIIPGNGYSGTSPTGGSASPGRGVSVRCFSDALDSIWVDTDVNGQPDLSNIIVTYNHLNWQPDNPNTTGEGNDERFIISLPPHRIDCTLVSDFVTCTGFYDLPQIGDVVRVGDPLGQTGADPNFDHLHLSLFLARGFARSSLSENSFYLNPMLMYDSANADVHVIQSYYPYILNSQEVDTTLGIGTSDLKRWAGGGWNSQPDGDTSTNSFWAVQTPTPPPPNHVEWSHDNYPLFATYDDAVTTNLIEYLDNSFSQLPYVHPNCALSFDTNRLPQREIADCTLTDLDDETPYSAVAHPTPTP